MSSFQRQYEDAFEALGRPLSTGDAIDPQVIAGAERRLLAKVPDALKAFYIVAGNAVDLMDHYDHLIAPAHWSLHNGNLTFLSENQAVVLYGTAYGRLTRPSDPPVFMANNQEPYEWYHVCDSTSQFLQVMLRWEGAFGGAMPYTATGLTPPEFQTLLANQSWQYVGEVNDMRAYSKPLRALCHVQWSDGWRVFAGATSDTDLTALGEELGIELYDEL